jgi:hypothetical protein
MATTSGFVRYAATRSRELGAVAENTLEEARSKPAAVLIVCYNTLKTLIYRRFFTCSPTMGRECYQILSSSWPLQMPDAKIRQWLMKRK